MEGVGARLGRSSTRYGPATVFSGPVRKWKKGWIHVSPSNNNNSNSSNNNHSHLQNHYGGSSGNGNGNGNNNNNGSHLLLYKWTPLTQRDSDNNSNGGSNTNGSGEKDSVKEDDTTPEEPPRRKFKYIPIALLEEQNRAPENEAVENADIHAKPTDSDPSAVEPAPRSNGVDEKPDINDVPMEENQDDEQIVQQDLSESTLDLSLGLKARDGDSTLKQIRPETGSWLD